MEEEHLTEKELEPMREFEILDRQYVSKEYLIKKYGKKRIEQLKNLGYFYEPKNGWYRKL